MSFKFFRATATWENGTQMSAKYVRQPDQREPDDALIAQAQGDFIEAGRQRWLPGNPAISWKYLDDESGDT